MAEASARAERYARILGDEKLEIDIRLAAPDEAWSRPGRKIGSRDAERRITSVFGLPMLPSWCSSCSLVLRGTTDPPRQDGFHVDTTTGALITSAPNDRGWCSFTGVALRTDIAYRYLIGERWRFGPQVRDQRVLSHR